MEDKESDWTMSTPLNFGRNLFNQIERFSQASSSGDPTHMQFTIDTYKKLVNFALDPKTEQELKELDKEYFKRIAKLEKDQGGNVSQIQKDELDRWYILEEFGIYQDTLFRHNMLGFTRTFDVILEEAGPSAEKTSGNADREKGISSDNLQ